MQLKVRLLDFSSGDVELTRNGETTVMSNDKLVAILANEDPETKITLIRAYAPGELVTTVRELPCGFGLWIW